MSAVRLIGPTPANPDRIWSVCHTNSSKSPNYIALPAAEHAALVALLGEARAFLLPDSCDSHAVNDARCALCERIDAALAGLEGGAK